jgi:predicted transcriptional regulator
MSQQTTTREHIGAFIPAEQRRQLIELARSQDRSVSSVIRQALKAHVERAATAAESGGDPEGGEES